MTAQKQTFATKIRNRRIAHELTNPFFEGGHFTEEVKEQPLKAHYRISVVLKGNERIDVELINSTYSNAKSLMNFLCQNKIFISQCLYDVNAVDK
jgi:hypothetical protein